MAANLVVNQVDGISSICLSKLNDEKLVLSSNFTCACCHFQSRPHKLIPSGFMVAINGDCLCALCAGSQLIGSKIKALKEYNAWHGKLIYSDLSQAQISHLVRTTYGAMKTSDRDPIKQVASQLFDHVNSSEFFLNGQVHSFFDGCEGDLTVLANLFSACDSVSREKLNKLLSNVRYLPDERFFGSVINFWTQANREYFQ